MKRKLNWTAALAATLMATTMTAPVESHAQSTGYVNGYNRAGVQTPPGWMLQNNSWINSGYESRSWYDARYGWIRADRMPDGSVAYYTFGYQIVLVWTNSGYVETYHNGTWGVPYRVLYGPRP